MPLDIMKYHDKFQCSYSNCSENVYYGLFFEKKKKMAASRKTAFFDRYPFLL